MSQIGPRNGFDAGKHHFFETVGRRLQEVREAAGISQLALAKRLGCATSTLGGAEDGSRTVSLYTLACIAEELDVTLDELVPLSATEGRQRGQVPRETQTQRTSVKSATAEASRNVAERGRPAVVTSGAVRPGQIWSFETTSQGRVTFEVVALQMTLQGPRVRGRETATGKTIMCPVSRLSKGLMGARLEREAA